MLFLPLRPSYVHSTLYHEVVCSYLTIVSCGALSFAAIYVHTVLIAKPYTSVYQSINSLTSGWPRAQRLDEGAYFRISLRKAYSRHASSSKPRVALSPRRFIKRSIRHCIFPDSVSLRRLQDCSRRALACRPASAGTSPQRLVALNIRWQILHGTSCDSHRHRKHGALGCPQLPSP